MLTGVKICHSVVGMITLRVTIYGIFRNGQFVTAYATQAEAETVARGLFGICEIVPLKGKLKKRT